ncbi:MAG: cobalamin-binding protein [Candidatus Zixiibacteriota bacterium]|nr:MAG: cobalamin-binding protein [candidate division Zixibacteria bacterium]
MPDDITLSEEELHAALAEAVVNLDLQRTGELAQAVLDRGFSARRAILEGLSAGMRRVGDKFCSHEFFVPEVVVASRAMYRGFNLLKPRMLEEGGGSVARRGRVAIAVVQGDLHDIGKNIVRLLLEADGFAVDDLGKNVPPDLILEHLQQNEGPSLLALSTLMTSTMDSMRRTVEAARARFPQIRIMVGGAPVSEAFARDLGADGTAGDAAGAVQLARRLAGGP